MLLLWFFILIGLILSVSSVPMCCISLIRYSVKLIIEKDDFKLLEPCVKSWYPAGEKQRRTKLRQVFNC